MSAVDEEIQSGSIVQIIVKFRRVVGRWKAKSVYEPLVVKILEVAFRGPHVAGNQAYDQRRGNKFVAVNDIYYLDRSGSDPAWRQVFWFLADIFFEALSF